MFARSHLFFCSTPIIVNKYFFLAEFSKDCQIRLLLARTQNLSSDKSQANSLGHSCLDATSKLNSKFQWLDAVSFFSSFNLFCR
jgi:hypothetical protein